MKHLQDDDEDDAWAFHKTGLRADIKHEFVTLLSNLV